MRFLHPRRHLVRPGPRLRAGIRIRLARAVSSTPTVRAEWAGPDVRINADTATFSAELTVPVDDAERLVESLQRAIAGARGFIAQGRE